MISRVPVALAVLFVLVSGDASAGGGWRHVSITRGMGTVEATLSYEARTVPDAFPATETRRGALVVRRAGKVVIDVPIPPGTNLSLTLRNVWGTSEPEALVDVSSCGNRCSQQLEVGLIAAGGTGRVVVHDFGAFWSGPDTAWSGQWRDGTFYFVSYDQRFFCEFVSCAGSGVPVQVFAIDHAGRRFADVTRSRRDLIEANAALWWKAYLRERGTGYGDVTVGLIAPWCADQYLLGRKRHCDQALAQALARGYLHGPPLGDRDFIKLLHEKLAAWGYDRG